MTYSPMLQLPNNFTIASTIEIKTSLNDLLPRGAPITIDGSAVTRADAAALQLLVSFSRAISCDSGPIQWSGLSPELIEAATLCGLAAELGLVADSEEVRDVR